MPPEFADWGKRWAELHPDWEHRLWTDREVDAMPAFRLRSIFDAAAEYVPEARIGQFRSDVLRYEILLREGGVYVDCDFEPRKAIDELLRDAEPQGAFAAWEVPARFVGNSIIGAEPRHPFLMALVRNLPRSLDAARKPSVPGRITGPQYLTRVFRHRQAHNELHVFPRGLFYPYGWDDLDGDKHPHPSAFAVHHWANKRREAHLPLPASA